MKALVQSLFHKLGLEVRRYRPAQELEWLMALEDGATAAELGGEALGFCRKLAGHGVLERA